MIYHYINLVAWDEVNDSYSSSRDVFFCDSVSLLIMARLFGKKVKLMPGPKALSSRKNLFSSDLTLFLVSDISVRSYSNRSIVLPFFEKEVYLNSDLLNYMEKINVENIFIGVSTPKQNSLAQLIYSKNKNVDIYCFGAAIASNFSNKTSSKFDFLGFQWIGFLIESPTRTIKKIYLTLQSIKKILSSKDKRVEFIAFCERLEK